MTKLPNFSGISRLFYAPMAGITNHDPKLKYAATLQADGCSSCCNRAYQHTQHYCPVCKKTSAGFFYNSPDGLRSVLFPYQLFGLLCVSTSSASLIVTGISTASTKVRSMFLVRFSSCKRAPPAICCVM